jgi:hypothetical protein
MVKENGKNKIIVNDSEITKNYRNDVTYMKFKEILLTLHKKNYLQVKSEKETMEIRNIAELTELIEVIKEKTKGLNSKFIKSFDKKYSHMLDDNKPSHK